MHVNAHADVSGHLAAEMYIACEYVDNSMRALKGIQDVGKRKIILIYQLAEPSHPLGRVRFKSIPLKAAHVALAIDNKSCIPPGTGTQTWAANAHPSTCTRTNASYKWPALVLTHSTQNSRDVIRVLPLTYCCIATAHSLPHVTVY